jgi:diaminopimelate decarboxylase
MALLGNNCGSESQFDDFVRDVAVAAARRHAPNGPGDMATDFTHVDRLGRLCVGGMALTEVADEFGTPTYVIDEADFRHRIRRFCAALPHARVVYARKALLTTAIDSGSRRRELALACAHVVSSLPRSSRAWPEPLLYLVGLQCHIGSQVTDASLYGEAIRQMIPLMAEIRARHGVIMTELNIGGGQGIPYASGDQELDLDALRDFIDDALDASCAAECFPRPTVVVEPGRAISARADITLYRVRRVQAQPGGRAIVVVDGGSSDNPRVVPCDARTTIALANRHSMTATQPMTVVGRQGDSGDEIARDVLLPDDLHAGDLLAVACTGAYHHSMASTYPMVGRPPLVTVRDGSSYELVRRETIADLLSRDLSRDRALNKRPPMQRESTESSCEALPCGEWPAFSDGVTSVVEL